MTLKDVQKTYEVYGKEDPLYAVLSRKDAKDNKWDADEFFATGRAEIADAMRQLASLGVDVKKGRAMDFGCGVGRLTQALCEEFGEAVGIDISYSMIENAEKYNKFGDRCEFRVNTTDDLARISHSLVKIRIFRSQNVNEPGERRRMVFVRGNTPVWC